MVLDFRRPEYVDRGIQMSRVLRELAGSQIAAAVGPVSVHHRGKCCLLIVSGCETGIGASGNWNHRDSSCEARFLMQEAPLVSEVALVGGVVCGPARPAGSFRPVCC